MSKLICWKRGLYTRLCGRGTKYYKRQTSSDSGSWRSGGDISGDASAADGQSGLGRGVWCLRHAGGGAEAAGQRRQQKRRGGGDGAEAAGRGGKGRGADRSDL
jgi:hypothetical protein